MKKLKKLVHISQSRWVFATILMCVTWNKIWVLGFNNLRYVMEDKFLYIGVLGGWMFVWVFWITIFIFIGWHFTGLAPRIAKAVPEYKEYIQDDNTRRS